jgi:excisionase family DNA binding protein
VRAVGDVTARLLTAQEAAELLRVPATWLLAQARRDAVPHVRLGRYVRFNVLDLERWIETVKHGPK